MYMEPISMGTALANTQAAVQQQAAAKVSNSTQRQFLKDEKVSALSNSGQGQILKDEKISAPKAKAGTANKARSRDGLKDLQVSRGSDESVTLSIQTDEKQLVDEQKNVDMEKLRKIMEKLAASISNLNSDAKFGIHEKTNRVMIKLVDKDTQEIIKEFPPEKSLDMLAKRLAIAGILVDERL